MYHPEFRFAKQLILTTLVAVTCLCPAADTQINTGFNGPQGTDTGWWPLDPNAAVGPNHVMVLCNGIYRIYTKTGTLVGSGSIDSYFNGVTPGVATLDPNITYDDIAGRFVVEANGSGGDITNAYVAVSNTSDPTAGFTEAHKIGFAGAYDGSKLGFNADVYVICATTGTAVIDKSTMLDANNGTFTVTSFTTSTYGRAARMHGATAGGPIYFTSASGGQIRVTRMTNVLSAAPTFTSYNVAGSSGCTDPATPGWRGNSLVTANTGAMYWWQVDTSTTTPTLTQQGFQAAQAGYSTAYGSANVAPNGDMGMSWMQYSANTTLLPVSMWVAWRAAADPVNTMRPAVMVRSSDPLTQANARHGDFSSTVCDISTNGTTLNTFWSCNGYIRPNGNGLTEAVWLQNFGGTPLLAPTITNQPQTVTVTEANPVTLSVVATGAQPFSYQWRTNGVPIPGATNNPFSLPVSVASDAGDYTVVITNFEGSATSAVATVTIVPAHDGTWINTAGGSWTNSANWSGGVVATGIGKTANFNSLNITASPTVTLDGARTVGQLVFGDTVPSHNWTISTGAGGSLTLNVLSNTPSITVSNQTATLSVVVAGTDGLLKQGAGTLALATQNTYTGGTTVSGGILDLTGGGGSSGTIRGTVTVNSGSTLRLSAGDVTGYNGDATCVTNINLLGGTLNVNTTVNQTLGNCVLNLTGAAITGNAAGNIDFFKGASALNTLASATPSTISRVQLSPLRQGNTTFNVAAGTTPGGIDLDISSVLKTAASGDAAGAVFTKAGPGVLRLLATNTYTLGTLVSGGTLLLGTNSSLASAAVTVATGATLAGNGTLKGAVTNQSGSVLSPGFNGIGTLTVSNTLVLQGTVSAQINKTAGTADRVQGLTSVNYGGTLNVTNLAGTLTTNDTFTLFSAAAYTGSFTSITLPVLGANLAWDPSNLAVNGSFKVVGFTGITPPATPTGVLATAISAAQINVIWAPVAGASTYVVSRAGAPVATVVGTNYVDAGLAMGTSYCYTVAAVNTGGSSADSASACAITFVLGGTLTWDADPAAGGIQDGNGFWGNGGTPWQYNGNNFPWTSGNIAAFGTGTTTNCTVTITNDVTPTGLLFRATGGGIYTLAGSGGGISLAGATTLTASNNATISAALKGTGSLVKSGAGTVTFTSQNTHTGGTTINEGKLIANAPNGTANGAVGAGNVIVNSGGILTASGDNSIVGQTTSAARSITINAGGSVTNTGTTSCHLNAIVLNGGSLGANTANGTYGNWNLDNGVSTPGNGTTSTMIGGNATLGQSGGTVFNIGADDTLLITTVLAHVGTDNGLVKNGPGTLVLNAVNTYTGPTTVNAGTLQVNGTLATNITLANTAVLSGTGIIKGPVDERFGALLAPGGASIGTLYISNSLSLSGDTFFRISKTGGVRTNDQVKGMTGVTFTDCALIVTNITSDGTPLAAGDTFLFFAKASGAFAGEVMEFFLPPTPTNLVWDVSHLETDGAITVVALPVITNEPQSLVVNPGDPATFSGSATGSPTLAYQWQKNGSDLSGATGLTYNIPSVTTNDAGDYTLVVTNAYGSTTSVVATLTVNVASINTTPTNLVAVVNGANLNLSWPSDHLGWQLQWQTNVLSSGLSTNWTGWPGSTLTNQVSVPIVLGNTSVFLRLAYPPLP